ncbi:uncharacterized protein LOC123541053 isoform X4 [Mercenaria mercenaria]|uniref:uncharacterized protein LOC123541053 isoform X4 n=1 Tax=Mercenaria mercenaria TaxID=6596 RepID=UPI00234E6C0D|nr:uncharacterized protein LOC123541053 isoform X4 [Mercenaria mercenaria]
MEKENKKFNPPSFVSSDESHIRRPAPKYCEVMGVYQTSVNSDQTGSDIPPLSYIDIMPRCLSEGHIAGKIIPKFEDFSAILEGANRWLQDHPGLTVIKCETVDKRLHEAKDGSLIYELNEMLRNEPSNGFTVYVKGLRMWMKRNPKPSSETQQIGIRNIVPEKLTIELPTHGHYRSGRLVISHEVRMLGGLHPFHTYEGFEDTIIRLKGHLVDDPIPGSILTIETDSLKVCQKVKKDLNPNSTCWSEEKDKWRRDTLVVRIYYIKGEPALEEIGYEDLVPYVIDPPESDTSNHGKFENFDSMISRLGTWVSQNQGVRIVNIQQFDARVHQSHVGTSLHISSDSTDHVIDTHSERRMARALRVIHVTTPLTINSANTATDRLFLPARTGHKTFETMTQTMERVQAWLRLTDVPVLSVETVYILFHEHNVESTDYTLSEYTVHAESGGKHWLTAIRLYLSSTYTEPDPADLPPVPEYHHGLHGHGPCSIL